jgi:hypothetical protein
VGSGTLRVKRSQSFKTFSWGHKSWRTSGPKTVNGHISVEMNLPSDTVFLNRRHQTSDIKLFIWVQMYLIYLETLDEARAVPCVRPLPDVLARSDLCRITNELTRKSNQNVQTLFMLCKCHSRTRVTALNIHVWPLVTCA